MLADVAPAPTMHFTFLIMPTYQESPFEHYRLFGQQVLRLRVLLGRYRVPGKVVAASAAENAQGTLR